MLLRRRHQEAKEPELSASTPQHFAPALADDARTPPPAAAGERETLVAFLDWHRATFEAKCSGLAPERLSERAVPPSQLSLHGLVRHLAGVERWWFRVQFADEDVPLLYYTDDDPDHEFHALEGDPQQALDTWRAECSRSREIVAAASLEETGIRRRTGDPVSLRRILVHMIAEYARHTGHADLLRERLDGATGW
nr:DinB family protein [Streptomyces xiaopingdaonensis]